MENLLHVNYYLLLEELENRNQINKKIDTKRTCVFMIRRMQLRAATIQLPHDTIRITIFASRYDTYRDTFLTAFEP